MANSNQDLPSTETQPNPSEDLPEPTQAESEMTEAIARDRPTIDAAVKSFISMVCARKMAAVSDTQSAHDKVMMGIIPGLAKSSDEKAVASETASKKDDSGKTSTSSVQSQVLELARAILKAVNSYTFPVHDTVAYSLAEKPGTTQERKQELLEISVVARLWNALIQSEQKPSRFLGRRALKLAWKNLEMERHIGAATDKEQQSEWLKQFEELLFASPKALPSNPNVDDDSALLWAADGGASELAKRRQRRLDGAKERGPSTPS